MRIMGFLRASEQSEGGGPPTAESMEAMGAFMQEVTAAGVLEATNGLTPSAAGKRINCTDGQCTVTDGPFANPRELTAAYCVYNVKSWDEAVYWTKRFLQVIGGGECDLRPIFDPSEFSVDTAPSAEVAPR